MLNTFHLAFRYLAKFLSYVGLFLMVASSLQAQSLLTLEEVIETVLENNLAIQMARNEQKIAVNNYRISNTGFLPALDMSLGGTANQPNRKQNTYHIDLLASSKLNWNLFNGMQSILAYQHLAQLRQISRIKTQQAVEATLAEAIKAYYGLVIAQEKQQVLKDNLIVAKEVLQFAQAKYEVGDSTQLDYLAAQVQHNKERAKLLLQEEVLTAAQLSLWNLLNKDGLEPEECTTVDTIPIPQPLIWEAVKTTNPVILIAQKQCEEALTTVKLQRAKLRPRVDFWVGYNLGTNYQKQAWTELPTGVQCGINISFNLFHAFQHKTAIQEAKVKAENAQLNLAMQQIQLDMKLKQQFSHYAQQFQRYEFLQQHVRLSQESASMALEQYQLGKITLLELNKAQQSKQEAELEYLQILHEAKVAEITLLELGGKLLDHYKITSLG